MSFPIGRPCFRGDDPGELASGSLKGQLPVASRTLRSHVTLRHRVVRSYAALAAAPGLSTAKEASSNQMEWIGACDIENVRRHMSLPRFEEFPNLPRESFRDGVLYDPYLLKRESFLKGAVRSDFKLDKKHMSWRCFLSYSHDSIVVDEICGDGKKKRIAEAASYLHLIGRLYEDGLLHSVLNPRAEAPTFHPLLSNTAILKREKDALFDVYHFCARHLLEVKVSMDQGTDVAVPRVMIELPKRDLRVDVTIRGPSKVLQAEITAAVTFMQELEKRQSEDIQAAGVENCKLSVENARDFVLFCLGKAHEHSILVDSGYKHRVTSSQVLFDGAPIGNRVFKAGRLRKSSIQELAFLSAAVAMAKARPERLMKFFAQSSAVLARQDPRFERFTPYVLDESQLELMQNTIAAANQVGLRAESDVYADSDRDPERRRPWSSDQVSYRSKELWNASRKFHRASASELPVSQKSGQVIDIIEKNRCCFIIGETGSGKTTQVPQIVLDHAIESFEGGSCNIICTQPRRMAAVSVARHVACERGQPLGDQVGYHVRFDAQLPQDGGSIIYCTTGIFLQRLQHALEYTLDHISHLIIDEVHERNLDTDLLLTILKRVLPTRIKQGRKVPKVVLMSATADAEKLAKYLETPDLKCPTIRIPGQAFPVKEHFLEDFLGCLPKPRGEELKYVKRELNSAGIRTHGVGVVEEKQIGRALLQSEHGEDCGNTLQDQPNDLDVFVPVTLIADLIIHLANSTDEGAILTFLPGLSAIRSVKELLDTNFQRNKKKVRLYVLHSTLQGDQDEVFNPVPAGSRKIILATNIAETSITIPEVRYVVDCGIANRSSYEFAMGVNRLQGTWISKSSQKQRAGRAGRVRRGDYYALYTRARRESFCPTDPAEMSVCDLQETCLTIKSQFPNTPIHDFISDVIDPPSSSAVNSAIKSLVNLGAIYSFSDERFTPLGRLLSTIPLHPALGKMIISGVIYHCLDSMIILGVSLSNNNRLFYCAPGGHRPARAAKVDLSSPKFSDHFALLVAFNKLRLMEHLDDTSSMDKFCCDNFIDIEAYYSIKSAAQHIFKILGIFDLFSTLPIPLNQCEDVDNEFGAHLMHGGPALNSNSGDFELIRGLLLSGHDLNIARKISPRIYETRGSAPSIMVRTSVLCTPDLQKDREEAKDKHDLTWWKSDLALVTYAELIRVDNNKFFRMRENTEITPLIALLFAGTVKRIPDDTTMLLVNNWLRIKLLTPPGLTDPHRDPVDTILSFRDALRCVEAAAYKEMRNGGFTMLQGSPIREMFSLALGEVLNAKGEAVRREEERWAREEKRAATEIMLREWETKLLKKPVVAEEEQNAAEDMLREWETKLHKKPVVAKEASDDASKTLSARRNEWNSKLRRREREVDGRLIRYHGSDKGTTNPKARARQNMCRPTIRIDT